MAVRSAAQWCLLFIALSPHAVGATLMGQKMLKLAKEGRKPNAKALATELQHKAMRILGKARAKAKPRRLEGQGGHGHEDGHEAVENIDFKETDFDDNSIEFKEFSDDNSIADDNSTAGSMCDSPEFTECLRRCMVCLECDGDHCKDADGGACDTCDPCSRFAPCLSSTPPIRLVDYQSQDGCLPDVEGEVSNIEGFMLDQAMTCMSVGDEEIGSLNMVFDGFKLILNYFANDTCKTKMFSAAAHCGCGTGMRVYGSICDDVPPPMGHLNFMTDEGGCDAKHVPVPPLHRCLVSPFPSEGDVYMVAQWEGPRLRTNFFTDSECTMDYQPDEGFYPTYYACVCTPPGMLEITSMIASLSGSMCTPDKHPTGKLDVHLGSELMIRMSVWDQQCIINDWDDEGDEEGRRGHPVMVKYSSSVHYMHIFEKGDFGCMGHSWVDSAWVCGKCRVAFCWDTETGGQDCIKECFDHFAGCYNHLAGPTCMQVPSAKAQQQHDLIKCPVHDAPPEGAAPPPF